MFSRCFAFTSTAPHNTYTLSLHDALPIWVIHVRDEPIRIFLLHHAVQPLEIALHLAAAEPARDRSRDLIAERSEEHTSELQSRQYLVCRLLLEKKKTAAAKDPSEFICSIR